MKAPSVHSFHTEERNNGGGKDEEESVDVIASAGKKDPTSQFLLKRLQPQT